MPSTQSSRDPDVPNAPNAPAWRSPAAWAVLLVVFTLALAADLGTKSWSFRTVGDRPVVLDREQLLANPRYDPVGFGMRRAALPADLLDFKLVLNPGAVFGLGANQRWFFVAFTIGALAVGLHVFAHYTDRRSFIAHIAIAMILAGGIGNLYDRLAFGRVRDFIHALPGRRLPFGWTWPGGSDQLYPWIFNIADAGMCVALLMLLIVMYRGERSDEATERRNDEGVPSS